MPHADCRRLKDREVSPPPAPPMTRAEAQCWLAQRLQPGRSRDFYTAVQTLSRWRQARPCSFDANHAAASDDGVVFAHATTLCFEAQELYGVSVVGTGDALSFRVMVCFLGLLGTTSPLPQALTESVIHQEEPSPVAHLFDTVHHRLMQHLVTRHRQTHMAFARCADFTDVWSQRLLAWTPHSNVLSQALRWRYARVLMQPGCSSAQLAAVLQDVLARHQVAADVVVRPMTGGWVPLDLGQTCVLGGALQSLGQSCVMGRFAWAPDSAFAVDVHPHTQPDYEAMTQSPQIYDEVAALVGALGPLQTRCDVHLWLKPHMATAVRLGQGHALSQACWLGTPKTDVRLLYLDMRRCALKKPPMQEVG